ncbi:MAG: hypothetical protein Q4G27_10110 [Flavobacteriaceae bacterium]|nr:hypothetical protein [Flavobacteriaceae bacterium]
MNDFRDIEVKAGNHSFIITTIIGLLSLLLLLISFKFQDTYPKFQPIEIAMNFGNTEVGQGEAEPRPADNTTASAASASAAPSTPQTQPQQPATTVQNVVTQNTTESRPVAAKTPAKNNRTQSTQNRQTQQTQQTQNTQAAETPANQGDSRANSALSNIIGGKGKENSGGQGNNNVPGNVGDPKGSDSDGTGIGENWRSRIPEPQSHDCDASGVIVVNIVVNSSGGIKSAVPGGRGSTSNDACLRAKAKELVERYVRAHPGSDGRTGSYRVNLR